MSTRPIEIAEARRIIHEAELKHSAEKVIAAFTLMDNCERDLSITFADMLRCLDYGGCIAEVGARCLYLRTGRESLDPAPAAYDGKR